MEGNGSFVTVTSFSLVASKRCEADGINDRISATQCTRTCLLRQSIHATSLFLLFILLRLPLLFSYLRLDCIISVDSSDSVHSDFLSIVPKRTSKYAQDLLPLSPINHSFYLIDCNFRSFAAEIVTLI